MLAQGVTGGQLGLVELALEPGLLIQQILQAGPRQGALLDGQLCLVGGRCLLQTQAKRADFLGGRLQALLQGLQALCHRQEPCGLCGDTQARQQTAQEQALHAATSSLKSLCPQARGW